MQKVRKQIAEAILLLIVSIIFQVLFTPFRVFFTFPSQYLYTIGR